MKLVAYTRVSRMGEREETDDSFISVKVQLEQIEHYAKAMGHEIVAHFSDLDQSGGKASRPEFDKALAVATNGADGLIVAKLDRFSRNVSQALKILEALNEKGKQIVSVTDNVDTSTAMGKAMWQIILVFAELERGRASESWKAALSSAVGRGIHVASRVPTGYRRRKDRRLEPDPVAAPIMRELFVRRAQGQGWSALARFLNESGLVGPYGSPRWTHTGTANMVKNRVYLGEARNGSHVNPDAHEAIVTQSEWDLANVRGITPASKPFDALLSGLCRCAGCRYVLKTDQMKDRDGQRIRLYRCRGDHASGKCSHRASSLGRVLEPYIEAQFLAALGPDGPLAKATASSLETETAETAVQAAETELNAYLEAVQASTLGAERYRKGLQQRQGALDVATAKLAKIRSQQPATELLNARLGDVWADLSTAEKRTLLAAGIDAVMVRQGGKRSDSIESRVKILWHGEAPSDFPRRGYRPELKGFAW
jgi:DNA invertase Pin-like site-specific DNA recombinase